MLNAVAAALLASAIIIPPGAPNETPPPDHITIDIVTINGSGCPAGTAAVAVSEDNKAFTVTYSDYLAQVGVGAGATEFRKNCQLNLRVNVPQGFTFGIAQADYRGFAHIERGAYAVQKANYYFQGMSQNDTASHRYNGPHSDSWQATDTTEIAAIVYSPCGERRNFNINTELRVYKGTSDTTTTTSFVSMDSTDGAIDTTYRFSWKQCP
jgi:hypothetical protein